MPLYEYDCQDCGAHAEILVRGQETPHCPACEGTQLQRTLSTFAVSTGTGSNADLTSSSCSRCSLL